MAPERPDIEYPCIWEFRIIGADEAGLREAIAGVVGNQNHEIQPGHTKGAWVSIHLTLWVLDEEHRNTVYRMLQKHPLVKMIL